MKKGIKAVFLCCVVTTMSFLAFCETGNNIKINMKEYSKTSLVTVIDKEKSVTINGSAVNDGSDNDYIFIDGRNVTLNSYAIGKYEVTQELFEAVMGINPSYFTKANGEIPVSGERQELRPVEMVNWYDAIAFCNKLTILSGGGRSICVIA